MSTTNAIDHIKDLIKLLQNHKPHHPVAQHNDDSITALNALSDVFNIATSKPITPKKTPHLSTAASPRVQDKHSSTASSPRVHRKTSPITTAPTTNHFTSNKPSSTPHCHPYDTRSKNKTANAVLNTDTGLMEEYRQLHKGKDKQIWQRSFSNELGRLAQGIRDIKGTDCITFIPYEQIPKDKKVAYARIVCSIRPQKKETHRTRMTIGGNVLDYDGKTKTPTADLITLKLLLNSVLSTPKAKFCRLNP